jgi:hypothetical protein
MDMIELHGTLTLADFARFHYFHSLRWMWPVLVVVLVFCALIIALIAAFPNPGLIANTRPLLILFAVWIFLLAVTPFLSARRQFAKQAYLREPWGQIFTTEGIKTSSPSTSSEMKWSILQSVRETNRLFLLYYAPTQALIIPKRFFSNPELIESWRQMVERSIAPRKMSKLGFVGAWF